MSSASPSQNGPFSLITTPAYTTGKTDQYTAAATEMAVVHNCLMRGFNSVYAQAQQVESSGYKNFISYAHALFLGLHAHHTGEETFAFPEIEAATGEKGIMDVNVAQHEAFHDGLEQYEQYLASFLTAQRPLVDFSGTHLRSIIESFAPALNQHLHDEIDTLLSLAKYGDSLDLAGICAREARQIMGSMSKTAVMPAFLLNNDAAYEGGLHAQFPPVPRPVRWVFLHICTLWYWKWWRYASCDTYGRLKVQEVKK